MNALSAGALRPAPSCSPEEKAQFKLPEGSLLAIHFRAIERIYGDQGPTIADLLRKNPTVAVPVILVRLAQKDTGEGLRGQRQYICGGRLSLL